MMWNALDSIPISIKEKPMAGPLHNVRVLDLSRILAGPWASQTLADLGAEVIKVERPGSGDDTRGWGPPFIGDGHGSTGDAAYFLSANRGKRSVEIDMATPAGQELIRDLAAKSDVVIENFKVGGLKKYGLDYDGLKAVNPGIIYCSITGFGQDGPYAQRAGYDFMIQGMGGIMSITGQPDGSPGAEPMKSGMAFADIFTGLYSVIGILGALHHKALTGEGQHIDMALLDSQVAVLGNQALNYLVSGNVPRRLGNAHPNIVPYQTFETKDGHIIIAVGNDRQYRTFCELAGVGELATDPRFADNRSRVVNRDELVPLLVEAVKHKTTAEWVDVLEEAAVPCGPINTIDQVFDDAQVKARGIRLDMQRDNGVATPGVANPIRYSRTAIEYNRPAPALGSDTDTVLSDVLGLSSEEIDALRAGNTIGPGSQS
jgi:crotonobetainyl-CoA:carnitine CoA-transferase CaiB-like acyl-CoA transferase